MILTYQYRVLPSPEQAARIDWWLELLRRHWNYALGQRYDYLRRTRCQIDRCSIISEPIGELPEPVNYFTQQSALKETKRLFPDYRDIYSETQQMNLQRLDKAWKRWRTPDKTGKRGGRPRFKKAGEMRSFSFSRVNHEKAVCHLVESGDGRALRISRFGLIPVVMHRELPNGFDLKQATIVKKADGYYVCLSLQDDSVPAPMPVSQIHATTGIDVGLEKFLVTADGKAIPVPQFYRQAQSVLARAQRKLARMVKGSVNWQRQRQRIARLHLRVARCRQHFHYQVAHWLYEQYDLIGFENLNIRGLARTRLAKSILDAAWGAFLKILQAVAVKRGKWAVECNAAGTSIECSGCGARVEKTLADRVHACDCGLVIDRDWNSARVIESRALQAVG